MLPDRLFSTFQTAAQGMAQQRKQLETAARNIAHAETASRPGSTDAYRPETVRSTPVDQRRFHELLRESVTSLRQTQEAHIEGGRARALNVNGDAGGTSGMGPTHRVESREAFRLEFDPTHPDADEEGMVQYPDVDMIRETVNMVKANRLYEANLSSIEAEKQMIRRALEM